MRVKIAFCFFTLMVFASVSLAEGRWEVIRETKVKDYFDRIQFFDEDTGFLIGRKLLMFTKNGGITLSKREYPMKVSLYAVYFLNSEEGFATRAEEIYHTEDGGRRWRAFIAQFEKDRDAELNTFFGRDLHFVSPEEGWILGGIGGSRSVILHTTDGGRTWKKQFDGEKFAPGGNLWLSDIFFVDSKSGWAVGIIHWARQGIILRTTDGGKTWTHQKISDHRWWLNKVWFVNDKVGWIIGRRTILHTEEGGLTWVRQESGLEIADYRLMAMHFINEQEGWITGKMYDWKDGNKLSKPILFHTEDGGKTWSSQKMDMSFDSIFFVNSKKGWGGGIGLIAYTKDGGKTWIRKTGASYSMLRGVDFISPKKGWAVGGEFLETEDGVNWKSIPVWGSFRDFDFIDERRGWGVWANGDLYRTTDGGANWEMLRRPARAYKIRFLDSQRGWIITVWGRVFYTQDGGKNWEVMEGDWGPPSQIPETIDFVGKEGWIVCMNGEVYYTSDGGKQWERISAIAPPNRQLLMARGMCFANNEEGWVVAGIGEGEIYHTEDGGKSWKLQAIPVRDENLMDICYDGGKHLYAVGNWGAILRYTDYKLLSAKAVQQSGKQMTSLGNVKNKAMIRPASHPIISKLYQNYPNPFNPGTWIPFQLAKGTNVSIRIYDAHGKLVRLLSSGQQPAGVYLTRNKAVYWDGKDSFGEKVASGVYFYTLQAGEFRATRKMLIMK